MPKVSQYGAMTSLTGEESLLGLQGTQIERTTIADVAEYAALQVGAVTPTMLDEKVAFDTLAEDTGSTLVGFVSDGVGATARTLKEKLTERGVSVRDFGAVGDGVSDDTASINAAASVALASGRDLYLPAGEYVFDGFSTGVPGASVSIIGEEGDLPVLRPSQAAVDSGNYVLLSTETRYSTVDGLSLATNIKPNQRTIELASVTGLTPGMVIQISSDRLWYNGNRGTYYCGEIHQIDEVDAGTNTIRIKDYTRDVYTTSQVLTIRAWVPMQVTLRNLRIEAPYPASVVTSVGIALQQCVNAVVENVHLSGFQNSAILENLCIGSKFSDIYVDNNEEMSTAVNGYGIESNGSLGTVVDGLYTKGLRRAWDAGAISGTTLAAITRDWTVRNFRVIGGGAWHPDTAEISYGVGMHGPSENGYIHDGLIQDTRNGITARGRNTIVERVHFYGTMSDCISLHEEGAGLVVRGCTYNGDNYPDKFASLADIEAGSGCGIFVRLGLDSGGTSGNCLYTLPIIIEGNSARGLTESLIRFGQNGNTIKNLHVANNYVEAMPGAAGTFTQFDAAVSGTNWNSGWLSNNRVVSINGSAVGFSSNIIRGYRDVSDPVVDMRVDGAWQARVTDDTVVRIPGVALSGIRPVFIIGADAAGHGIFRMIANNATLTNLGGTPAAWVGSATGSAMTGTTGVDGNVTFGLESNGDLYIENRAGGTYTFRVSPH